MHVFTSRTRGSMRVASLLVMALGGLLLSACASGGRVPDPIEVRDANGTLDGSPSIDADAPRVLGTYTAASGRLCRRLATPDGTVLARTSCRGPDGEWTLGRSLGRPAPLSAPALGSVVPVPVELESESDPPSVSQPGAAREGPGTNVVRATLRTDETLWSFAERLTGDPLNWARIARFNDIADGGSVTAGRELSVPVSIALAAR